MAFLRRHLTAVLIVLMIVVVNVIILRQTHWLSHTISNNGPIRYGDKMPDLVGGSLSQGSAEASENQTNLILYLSANQSQSRSVELAKYAETLFRRYVRQGLNVTALVWGDMPDIRMLQTSTLVTYAITFDVDGGLGNDLGLEKGQDGVFLFDRDGLCRFSTNHITTSEDLRQLIAVELLHVDPFDKSLISEQVVEEGQRLGAWAVTDLRTLEGTTVDAIKPRTANLFVFFTADCSICALEGQLKRLQVYSKSRGESPGQHHREPESVLVFDFNFSRSEVMEVLNRLSINSPAYVAKDKLEAMEQLGYAKGVRTDGIMLIQTDDEGIMRRMGSLGSFSMERGSGLVEASEGSESAEMVPRYEEVFPGNLDVYDVASYAGEYYVSDFRGNRIVVLDEYLNVRRGIGRIGSGPGQLIHPANIRVTNGGIIYVVDSGNDRIQQFDTDGHYVREFRTTLFEGFGLNSRGEVFLNQPEQGFLVTVYSPFGRKLRSLGKLKTFSSVYGQQFQQKDDPYKIAINRVRLSVDDEDNVYVSFMLAPLIQKYSPDGTLLFEKRLEGPEIENLTRVLVTDTPDKYISFAYDGLEERVIVLDPVVDVSGKRIYIILADGSVYVADWEGNKLSWLRPSIREPLYPYASALSLTGEVLVISVSRHCYRLILPESERAHGVIH